MKLKQSFLFCGALAVLGLNAGCNDKQETKVYSVTNPPATPSTATSQHGGMPAAMPPGHPNVGGMSSPTTLGGKTMPEIDPGTPSPQWEVQPPTSMRLASFQVKGDTGAIADISLVVLNGVAGGVLNNVNRWQTQLGQPDFTAEDLAQKVQHLPSPLGEMAVVDLQGLAPGVDASKDGRIVAAIVTSEDMAFFFKMRGNAELVGAQKAGFLQWVGTVRIKESKPDVQAKLPSTPTPAPDNAAASSPTPPQ